MKKQCNKTVGTFILLSLSLSACSGSSKNENQPNGPVVPTAVHSPISSQTSPGTCTDYSGTFDGNHVASLVLKQKGCESIELVQTCSAEPEICQLMDADNVSYVLPLNGSEVKGQGSTLSIRAHFADSALVIDEDLGGGKSRTKSITLSEHPCDPDNAEAGLEAQVTDQTASDDATGSSTGCEAWSRK